MNMNLNAKEIRSAYPGAIVVAVINGNRWIKGLILTSMLDDKALEELFAGKEIESPYDAENEMLALIEE